MNRRKPFSKHNLVLKWYGLNLDSSLRLSLPSFNFTGQAGRGFGAAHGYAYFVDSEIGMTMGDTTVKQLPAGTWKATCPIGTLFGSEVEGECSGVGPTKEAVLEALKQDRKNLNESLWA